MGAFFETISPSLIQWILEQQMFTVATAPLRGDGHVNVSPKGGKYFGVIDEKTFWYQELSGSGSETVSHLYEPGNGRITIMFNAFDGPPRILRLYGTGRCLEGGSADFHDFVKRHKVDCIPGTRSIIIVDVKQVGTSCGFSVPYYDFVGHRDILNNFYRKKQEKYDAGDEKEHLPRYWAYKNAWSVDGLPGMHIAQKTANVEQIKPIKKMVGKLAVPCYQTKRGPAFNFEQMVLAVLLTAVITAMLLTYGTHVTQAISTTLPASARRAITSPLATWI